MGEDIKRKESLIKSLEEDIDRLLKNIESIRSYFVNTLNEGELAIESKNKTVKKYLENLDNSLDTLESKISRSIDLQIDLLEDRLKNRCESVEEYSVVLNSLNATIERYNEIRSSIHETHKKYNGSDYAWENIKVDDRIESVEKVYIRGELSTLNQYFADVKTIEGLQNDIKDSDVKRRHAEMAHADDSQAYSGVFQEMRTMVLSLSSSHAFSERNYKVNADKFRYQEIGEIASLNRKSDHNKEERETLYNHYLLASRLFLSDLTRIFSGPDLDVPTLNDMVGKILNGEIDKNSKHETFTYIVEAQKYKPKDSDIKSEDMEILSLYGKVLDMHNRIDRYLTDVESHGERIDYELGATEGFRKEIEQISNKHKEDPILRRIFERVGLGKASVRKPGELVPAEEKEPIPIPILSGAGAQPPRKKGKKVVSKKVKAGLIITALAAATLAVVSFFTNNNGQVPEQAAQTESADTTKDNVNNDDTLVEISISEEIDLAILNQLYSAVEERKTVTDEELVDFVEELQEKEIFDEEKTKNFLELFEKGYEVTTPALNTFIQELVKSGHLTAENAISYLSKILPDLDPINAIELQEFIDSLPKSEVIDKEVVAEFVNSFASRIIITTENFDLIVTSLRNAGVDENIITEFTNSLIEIQAFDQGKVMAFITAIMEDNKAITVTATPAPTQQPSGGNSGENSGDGSGSGDGGGDGNDDDNDRDPVVYPSNPPQGDYYEDNQISDTPIADTVPVTENKGGAQGYVSQGNYTGSSTTPPTQGDNASYGTGGGPVTQNNPSQMETLQGMRAALTQIQGQDQSQGQTQEGQGLTR